MNMQDSSPDLERHLRSSAMEAEERKVRIPERLEFTRAWPLPFKRGEGWQANIYAVPANDGDRAFALVLGFTREEAEVRAAELVHRWNALDPSEFDPDWER